MEGPRPSSFLSLPLCLQMPFLEDVVLGCEGLNVNGHGDYSTWVDKVFDLGTIPPRLGGFKIYETSEDEGLFEMPFIWGSNCKVRWGEGAGERGGTEGREGGAGLKGLEEGSGLRMVVDECMRACVPADQHRGVHQGRSGPTVHSH
jgi:hypothetical protein